MFGFRLIQYQEESRSKIDEKCSCPDPDKAIGNETSKLWKSNHDRIVSQAKNAPADLDIVVSIYK